MKAQNVLEGTCNGHLVGNDGATRKKAHCGKYADDGREKVGTKKRNSVSKTVSPGEKNLKEVIEAWK